MFKFAIITSLFNEDITKALHAGACAHLQKAHGILDTHMESFWVPGAVEIPLIAKLLAKTKKYDAIICLGAVIRGETSHYDYVCQQVSYGCQKIALKMEIPVIFGILTTEDEQQAWARVGGEQGNKGHDAADAAVAMAHLTRRIGC